MEAVKSRIDHIDDILKELDNKDNILSEINYLQNVRNSEDDKKIINSIDNFVEYFNRCYIELTSQENEQVKTTLIIQPEAKQDIIQEQKKKY